MISSFKNSVNTIKSCVDHHGWLGQRTTNIRECNFTNRRLHSSIHFSHPARIPNFLPGEKCWFCLRDKWGIRSWTFKYREPEEVVYQDLVKIESCHQDGSMHKHPVILQMMEYAKRESQTSLYGIVI